MTAIRAAAVVPVRGGALAIGALETISEALELAGGPAGCRILLVGDQTASATDDLRDAGFGDITTLRCEAAAFAPARFAEGLADLIDDDEVVLVPASNDGRDLAPRLAARLDRPNISGATGVSADRALLARAGGTSLFAVEVDGPFVATLQPGARGVVERSGAHVREAIEVPAFAAFATAADAEVLEVLPAEASTIDLADASFIVGAGAGLGAPEAFAELEAVAVGLDASVGATRVVTDAGWTGHDRQIGTTGVVVDPEVYVAFGVSGAVQHTSGLGTPEHVISVNTDPHCPMMSWADLAIVADAPAVVAALRARLAGSRVTTPDADERTAGGTS
jgi:electron transfer flavoprotein alpha subunit